MDDSKAPAAVPGKPVIATSTADKPRLSSREDYLLFLRNEAERYTDCTEPGKPPWRDDLTLAATMPGFTGYPNSTRVGSLTDEQKLKHWRSVQRRAQNKLREALAKSSGSEHLAEAGLVLYDKMRQAIEQCANVDEVKEVRSKAIALALYRRQAGDREAEKKFAAIRIRAERRIGELLREMRQTGERAKAGDRGPSEGRGARPSVETQTLSDLNITKDESSKFQQLAAIPQEKFERAIAQAEQVPTSAGVISASKTEPAPRGSASNAAAPEIQRQGVAKIEEGAKGIAVVQALSAPGGEARPSRDAVRATRGNASDTPPIHQWVWRQLLEFDTTGALSLDAAEILAQMSSDERRDVARVAKALIPFLQTMIGECRKVHKAARVDKIAESDRQQMPLPGMELERERNPLAPKTETADQKTTGQTRRRA